MGYTIKIIFGFLPSSRTYPPLPRHADPHNSSVISHTYQYIRGKQWHGRRRNTSPSKIKLFAANNNLTEYFQNPFLLPQGHSWTKFTLTTKCTQWVISCLLGKQLPLGSLIRIPSIRKNTGRHGNAMPPHGTSTPPSRLGTTQHHHCCHIFFYTGSSGLLWQGLLNQGFNCW